MGGNNCKHANVEIVAEYDKEKVALGLATHRVADLHCHDCGTEYRAEQTIGNLTGHEYNKWKKVTEFDCAHTHFETDEKSAEVETQKHFSVLRFLGPVFEDAGNHSYLIADATCKRCSKKFIVRSDFHTEMRDEGKSSVRIIKGWEKFLQDKPHTKTVYKPELRTAK